ncbi:MAG: hypothetical protein ACOXZR_04315 [Bacilli bacterium]|jgi:cell division protein FtsL
MARNNKVIPIERLMIYLILFILLSSFFIYVFSKATLSKANIEVEKLRQQLTLQSNLNQGLVMQVNELKSFENIRKAIEREGLAYNNNNIKVIKRD